MSRALQIAILWKDYTSIDTILIYAHSKKLIMHVYPTNVDYLVSSKQFEIMNLVILHKVLVRTLLSEKRPILEQMWTRVWDQTQQANPKIQIEKKEAVPQFVEKYTKASEFIRS